MEQTFQKFSVIAAAVNYMEIPEGSVSLDSAYIERPPIESYCYKTILQPGVLLRIKAPRQLGKTSLLQRILHYAMEDKHRTAYLSLQSADAELLTNLAQFLQWLCTSITDELNIEERLEDYWNKGIGSQQKCSNYFQRYLLARFTEPLTLALYQVDRLFQYSEIAQ
ncbi:AAA-like domain-containing protein [Microseira sp. BLCC-F43]|uniref:AAA-like domain-containing protein n=1 Tax=Microseira sp. BLCC-F43 TaxID=3153602 RepID=UPI0035BC106E